MFSFSFKKILKRYFPLDFPGSPVVKTFLSNAGAAGLITGWGAKIQHASRPKNQNIIQKQYCNNKNLKNGLHKKHL